MGLAAENLIGNGVNQLGRGALVGQGNDGDVQFICPGEHFRRRFHQVTLYL